MACARDRGPDAQVVKRITESILGVSMTAALSWPFVTALIALCIYLVRAAWLTFEKKCITRASPFAAIMALADEDDDGMISYDEFESWFWRGTFRDDNPVDKQVRQRRCRHCRHTDTERFVQARPGPAA